MPAELLEILRTLGPGAGFIAILAWYIVRREDAHKKAVESLQKKLDDTQDKRVGDAHQVTDRLLGITEKWHRLIEELSKALSAQAGASDQMREAVDRLSERVGPRPR